MPPPSTNPRTRALTLPEVLATLTILTLLAAALLTAASESRRQSSLGDNFANLKQFAAATGAYAADNDDRSWTFSWGAGVDYGYGGVAGTDLQAGANQAWHIIRTRSGRPDWFGPTPQAYFMHSEARTPVMLADGSAAVRRTGDGNRGFDPVNPFSSATTRATYTPSLWEPPTLSGNSEELLNTYYRFTRSGLRGRDFGGPEVPWNN